MYGHRTRSVFDRYDIATDAETGEALLRVGTYLDTLPAPGPRVLPLPLGATVARSRR